MVNLTTCFGGEREGHHYGLMSNNFLKGKNLGKE